MKKYVILYSILFVNVLFAQNKYENFSVNDSIGIVETITLKEFIKPIFLQYKQRKINPDFLSISKNDSLIIFNKKNGNWEKPIFIRNYNEIYLTNKLYFHTVLNNKSVLIDANFKTRFQFKNAFLSLEKFDTDFICAKDSNSYTLFKWNKNTFELKHNLKATSYASTYKNENNGGPEEMLIFFGGNKTYVFNNNLELVKTHNTKITAEYEIYDLINPIQTKLTLTGDSGSNYKKQKLNPEEFSKISSDNDEVHKYTSEISDLVLVTASDYKLESYDSKNFIVFKIFKSVTKTGGQMTSMSTKNSFRFVIDSKTAKALIPLKYQLEMGLEILKKQ